MKKLAFISLAVLGFGGVTEMVLGMNPPDEGQCSQTKCNYEEVKQLESEKGKEILDEVADVSRNNPEMTAMIERIVKQAEDLREQVKSLKEKTNRLTMQETLSSEAERIKQLEESLSPEEKRRLEEMKNEPTCCFPRPTPKQIVQEQLHRLYKEKYELSAYIDGRKKTPSRFSPHFDSFFEKEKFEQERQRFEKEKQRFEQNKEIAIKRIPIIDAQIQSLRDRLNELS